VFELLVEIANSLWKFKKIILKHVACIVVVFVVNVVNVVVGGDILAVTY